MACVPVPDVDIPELPSPLTITPPAPPPIEVSAEVCCKLLVLDGVLTLIPFPPQVLNPGVIGFVNTNIRIVNKFIDALPLDCPRE